MQDLTGYLYQRLNLKRKEAAIESEEVVSNNDNGRAPRPTRRFSTKTGLQIIAPDTVVLASTKSSVLLTEMQTLNGEYILGKAMIEGADKVREKVIERAEKELGKAKLQEDIKAKGEEVNQKLQTYGKDPTDANRKLYDAAAAELKLLSAKLEKLQKAIDKRGAKFDEDIVKERTALATLNGFSEALSKRLSGPADKEAVDKRTFADYLRAEVIYEKLNATPKKTALWLEANVSANGANQMKKSSPIIDIFTRGPMLSYSGGAVVTYQMRDMDGTIVLAGTTWAIAPYRKSSNITKFECRSTRQDGELSRPYRNL